MDIIRFLLNEDNADILRDHYVALIEFAAVLCLAAFGAGKKYGGRKLKKLKAELSSQKKRNEKLEADLERFRTEEALETWGEDSDLAREIAGQLHKKFVKK